eukprot:COSAG02_NODE_1877_length_10559_cov_8.819025_9_plen_89_part_00
MSFEPMVQLVVRILINIPCYNSRLAGRRRRWSLGIPSLRAEDSEWRSRNAWTVMTPANVRIALHCDTDAVLHFALMLIDPGFVASQRL